MDISLLSILNLTSDELKNSKVELNFSNGSNGTESLSTWLRYEDSSKADGTCNDCSFWGWYGNKPNYKPGQWGFSFVRMHEANEWLFISAAEIIEVPPESRAIVRILDRFRPLFGRLIIKYEKGNAFARWNFKMEPVCKKAVVKELLPGLYTGRSFEGYDNVHLTYRELQDILDGKIMPGFQNALAKVSGIYCLTDKKNGKLYIGSATGENGIAQRWRSYLDSTHGDNKELIELYNAEGASYFEEYFEFTLLEFFSTSYDKDKVLERESYWKECLDTRRHGYNGN